MDDGIGDNADCDLMRLLDLVNFPSHIWNVVLKNYIINEPVEPLGKQAPE